MRKAVAGFALIGLVVVLTVGAIAPASAEFFGCNDRPGRVLSSSTSSHTYSGRFTDEFAAQASRPRVTIYPRRNYVGRNSIRQCRATLVREYRISGTVIVPHQQCWWE
jgi:hypothetical protein